ncbi:diacylglycerol/lipid kinase family protein [Microbacterium lacusdiani]
MIRRVGLVVNPTAGSGRGRRVGSAAARALMDAGAEAVSLSALDAVEALANVRRAVAEGQIDALVVVGGDGMVHLGIQALAETALPLGVVPVATGNDFAASAGLPRSPDSAIEAVRAGLVAGTSMRAVDLLRVSGQGVPGGERWVGGAVSAGLDGAANARANRLRWPRGSSRYVFAAVAEILGYRSWSYDVTVFDERGAVQLEWRSDGALVTVANAPRIGGGIAVAPSARVDDGILDVILAADVGRLTAARIFPAMLVGRHLRSAHLTATTGRTVEIAATGARDSWPAVFGDGELVGTLPVRVELCPGVLRLLG